MNSGNYSRTAVFFCVVIAAINCGYGAAVHSAEQTNISFKIFPDKEEYYLGESISLTLQFKNMSKQRAKIIEPDTKSFELAVKSDYWDEPRRVYVSPSGRASTNTYGDVTVQGFVFPPPMPVRLAENQMFSKKMNITADFYSDAKIQYPGEYEISAEFMKMGSNVIKIKLKEDTESISYLIRALEDTTEQTVFTMPSSKWATATLRRLTGQNYGFIYNLDHGWHARKKINLWKEWFARHKDALYWNKEKKMYEITPPVNDGDNDGVGDRKDKCPDTEKGMATGADGCPRDGDGDGVADHADKCPDNAEYQLSQGVNYDGCPKDSDGDGVADYADKCPDTAGLELSQGVNYDGCPKDSDGDGIPNYRDECPKIRHAPAVDADSCPPDSDKDAVPDYADKCPNNTGLELSQGVNFDGCAKDSDRDGIPNYRDSRPYWCRRIQGRCHPR